MLPTALTVADTSMSAASSPPTWNVPYDPIVTTSLAIVTSTAANKLPVELSKPINA